MDFYLTLLSDSNEDIFPTNEPSSFQNRFEREIITPPDTEVCLAEISYFQNFKYDNPENPPVMQIFDFFISTFWGVCLSNRT